MSTILKPLTRAPLSRRTFLTATAATATAGAMAAGMPSLSRAMESTTGAKRFVFILSGNGFDASTLMSEQVKTFIASSRDRELSENRWWGEGYSKEYGYGDHSGTEEISGGLAGAPGLEGLERRGLLDKSALLLGLHSKVVGGGHSGAHGILSSTRSLSGTPVAQTIDDFLSNLDVVRGTGDRRTPFGAIRLGIHHKDAITFNSSASGPGRALPTVHSPEVTWNAYVRPFVDPNGIASLRRRSRMLDLMKQDAMSASARTKDAARAQRYLDSNEQLIGEIDSFMERIDIYSNNLHNPPAKPDVDALKANPMDALDHQCDVAATALEAGLTNVITIGIGTASGYDFHYNLDDATTNTKRHTLCHEFTGTPEFRVGMRAVWAREVNAIARLAEHLDAVDEPGGEGSMLDHTAIVYVPDNGIGHHARAEEFPALLVGGDRLGLRAGGRAIIYPGYEAGEQRMQISHLWHTLSQHATGDASAVFEPAAVQASGILPEILTV